ncbi:MAG: response regulator [Candidatus Aminicenantes bacterium]|nr:MAG: response regulator [Candidatus Aminicenantes bacterium]
MTLKKRILLVDDDLDFLEMHKVVLVNHGYEVITATSAQEGLEKVRAEMPDLIVLDLMMEKHDAGFSFSKQIKSDPLFKKIPILMVTAVADATGFKFSLEKDGYWMKTDEFLDKPVEPAVLISKVEKLIGEKED